MRKRHIPASAVSHPNVTPLIDVVMCLIIFFMLVAKIGVSRGVENSIEIPSSIIGTDLQDFGNTLVLNVREVADQPFVTALVDGSSRQPIEVKLFDPTTRTQPLLEVLRKQRFGADRRPGGSGINTDNEQFKVIIRADQNVSFGALYPVMTVCAEAAVKNMNYNTSKPK